MFRPLKPYQYAVDVSLASICVLLRFLLPLDDWRFVLVVLLMGAALGLRRMSPGLALGVLWAGVTFQLVSGLTADYSNAAVLPVLYVTARYGSNAVRWLGLASAGFGALLATVYTLAQTYGFLSNGLYNPLFSLTELPRLSFVFLVGLVLGLGLFGLSWTLGLLARTWSTARDNRAAQQRAESEQAIAEREVGIEQERTRIARDMHDVVAHSLAVVIAQADGARYARAQNPQVVDDALVTISSTAREALADVRLLLGQLRHNEGAGPQPVLADLDRLIEQMRGSGLAVTRTASGDEWALGTGQQLAVYRIVQESLTNALRHGLPGSPVAIAFEWEPAALTLSISNSFDTAVSDRGHGLDGMRERAILAGGTLVAEPIGDQFVVTATLVAR